MALNASSILRALSSGNRKEPYSLIAWLTGYFGNDFEEELQNTLLLLRDESESQHWDDYSTVPKSLFPLNLRFDLEEQLDNQPAIQVFGAISEELIAQLRINPKDMFQLNPQKFEELIASLFKGFGFNVELTARTRDGGRDVIAVDYQDRRKYLIECMRIPVIVSSDSGRNVSSDSGAS